MVLSSITSVLLKRNTVGERRVDGFVRLGETGGGDLGHGLHGLRDVLVREPRFQSFKRRGQAVSENGDLCAAAFEFEFVWRKVGVTERLQQLDGGVLRQVQLVPPLHLWRHAASVSGVTRSSPVRRTDIRAAFSCPRDSSTRCSTSSLLSRALPPDFRFGCSTVSLEPVAAP